jgi:pyruvate formate-lyase/glycerol dehydratase family glycyl radical enzyme
MFELKPVTPRVQKLRKIYRDTIPKLDAERVRILTEFYRESRNEVPIIERAKALHEILSKMTVRVELGELLVGNMAKTFRGCCIWPEYGGLGWLTEELDSGLFDKKEIKDGFMYMDDEDREYVHSVKGFWQDNCIAAKLFSALPDDLNAIGTTGVGLDPFTYGTAPSGHYNANYRKAVEKGFGAIKREALEKLEEMRGKIRGHDPEKYFFYNAIVISCDSAILYAKRYAEECRKQAEGIVDTNRRTELLKMADSLDWIMENPARTFHEALQVCLLYQYILLIEGNYLGITIGRLDQHVGDYLKADLKSGRITMDEVQELMDCFFIKTADLFFSGPLMISRVAGVYSNNLRMTIGGRKPDGSDATNEATFLCLQSSARLRLHDPNLSLGLHKDSPDELLEAGIETSKIVYGIPCIENADLIIDILHKRGLAIEDARNYCVVGCIELSGSGCEWSNVSSPYSKGFMNIANILLQAINNGINPQNKQQGGLQTGYLFEMESFEQVKESFKTQLEYIMDWQFSVNNIMEHVGFSIMPVPMASATMDGCMENGRDMMHGGAKYNSTGTAILGIGTVIDSLSAIKYMVYDKKLCAARKLYDAIMENWDGHELLRQRIINEVPRYGNGDPYADELATWVADLYTSRTNSYKGPRGGYRAGIYSAGAHVLHGYQTYATPDGRRNGQPISDSASPSQGMVKNGPTGIARSILALNPSNFGNGLQFNMKFHPSSLQGEEGTEKMKQFIWSFFEQGGMQLQYNVVDAETLRQAQENPDEHRDLVVRVAGFSAYFVELYEDLQNEIITRSEVRI